MQLNPVQKRIKYYAAYILSWLVLTLFNILVSTAGLKLEFMYAAADSLVFNFILALLSLSFWYTVQYIPLQGTAIIKIIAGHLLAALAASLLWAALSYFILSSLIISETYNNFLLNSLGWRFLSGIIFYFFTIILYYLIIYFTDLQERIKKESELQSLVISAELRTLKFQINPHFLFNALNSLNALTSTDPQRAGVMTLKISDFLRYSLSGTEHQRNKLSEEIDALKLYMEIEKVRFEDKFIYTENISPEAGCVEVPALILQPLVENAFKHGVYEASGSIGISLTAAVENGYLVITVSNNFEQGAVSKKGEGLGLKNTSARLKLLYGENGSLDINDSKGIFSVKLVIPVGNNPAYAGKSNNY